MILKRLMINKHYLKKKNSIEIYIGNQVPMLLSSHRTSNLDYKQTKQNVLMFFKSNFTNYFKQSTTISITDSKNSIP